MSRGKIGKFVNDNLVIIFVLPLIVGVHYGWSKLQEVPYLVPPKEKSHNLPILDAVKKIKEGYISNTGENSEKTE